MRRSILAATLFTLTLCPASVQAGGTYAIYSGRGYNQLLSAPPAFGTPEVLAALFGFNGGSTNPATFGTAANPVPVRQPMLIYRIDERTVRVVPLER